MIVTGIAVICLGAYLLGSVNAALVVARSRGVDIRSVGSGNPGASNVFRILGRGLAAMVVLFDLLKGLLPALVGLLVWDPAIGALAGLCAVIGHCYPVFHRFRGGKGVATAGGMLLAVAWPVMIAMVVMYGVALALTRISAVGSLAAAFGGCPGVVTGRGRHLGGGLVRSDDGADRLPSPVESVTSQGAYREQDNLTVMTVGGPQATSLPPARSHPAGLLAGRRTSAVRYGVRDAHCQSSGGQMLGARDRRRRVGRVEVAEALEVRNGIGRCVVAQGRSGVNVDLVQPYFRRSLEVLVDIEAEEPRFVAGSRACLLRHRRDETIRIIRPHRDTRVVNMEAPSGGRLVDSLPRGIPERVAGKQIAARRPHHVVVCETLGSRQPPCEVLRLAVGGDIVVGVIDLVESDPVRVIGIMEYIEATTPRFGTDG